MPPICKDERLTIVPIGCGNCIECRQQRANQWRTRLHEEIKEHKYNYFVTLTMSDESFKNICEETNITAVNAIAKIMVRRFLERWRKKYKKSICHWLITELGEDNDRLHLHGFIMSDYECHEDITNIWQYGITYIGEYCNNRTINYCVKYALKIDPVHKDYKPIILCSKGIGSSYIDKNQRLHKYRPKDTIEYYKLPNGNKINLPIYYRNHFFTEEERTKLWQEKLDQEQIYVRSIPMKLNTEKGIQEYLNVLKYQRKENIELGYGDDSKEWKEKEYNITLRMLNAKRRLQKIRK